MTDARLIVTLVFVSSLGLACDYWFTEKPVESVLLISIDTLRADHLGAYGYVRDTSPRIDTLAKSSWVFDTAYAPVPRTGPSVAALLTGLFPANVTRWAIPDDMLTLAELLAERGWATVAAVDNANLSRKAGFGQGFDVYRETWQESDNEIERTRLITDTALERLEQFGDTGESFFMWLHYVNPHGPYTPPAGYDTRFIDDRYFDESVRLPRTNGWIGGIRRSVYVEGEHRLAYYVSQYDAEISFTDDQIGAVIDAVRAKPSLSNTLIVLTADHGEGLGEQDVYFKHGPYLLESHVRVPLIIHHPGHASRPQRIQQPVGLIDVMPTILDLADIRASAFDSSGGGSLLAGQSLVLTSAGELNNHRRDVFFGSRNYWGIRSGDWKFILKTRDDDTFGESRQLFNLRDDPEELHNVSGLETEESAFVLRRLEARRQLQTQFAAEGENWDTRSRDLSEKALENLRTLGYIR